ncbi:hypothetical protein CKK33_02010 [Mucilaginibacter sp. MD40]|uniref:RagB/SusD family nutrient uptake outer membrane protein n=1 Tax=Mucilaginibacter sp. MD40 TaxID=2029590 RepID=UPI000BAC5B2A|nr:RagB/SusD family nutrient uptake outer membrane protein [Mucilaginibacter sp. MD40]PAW92331.1 hypothetical protein CKK33_02010 [Mucilaginibacter sp. MD40]
MYKTHTGSLIILLLLGLCSFCCGCKKFLAITPSSQTVNPTTIKDFQEVLNSDSLVRTQFFPLDLMTDDMQLSDLQYGMGDNFYRRTYQWEQSIWNPAQIDFMYTNSYSRILQMNVILNRIGAAVADAANTTQVRNNIISQALINRAWYYLQLVNTYGAAYDPATAKSDPGVPLVTVPDAYALPARSSVEAVYTLILSDLKTAVANNSLPSKGIDIIHPGKAAGFALLARAYLYRADYKAAQVYADSSLNLVSSLLDQNSRAYVPNQLQDLVGNPEVLLGRTSTDEGFYTVYKSTFTIGNSLLDSLGGFFSQDKRFSTRFSTSRFSFGSYLQNPINAQQIVFDNSVAVPEVLLIKAECLARSGDADGAGKLLDRLRSNRIPPDALTARNYTAANILSYVLGERRRELCFHGGLRLFDLKRLNTSPILKTDLMRMSSSGTVYATLPAGSARYLFPFSPIVLAANPNIVQNPR